MSLDINAFGYKKFFDVSSELWVYKKGYKKIKCPFGKHLLCLCLLPQYGTSQYSSYFLTLFRLGGGEGGEGAQCAHLKI